MNELVSVIMSTYNEKENELKLSIESILSQTYNKIEFIIVLDNPKNERIADILEYYKSKDNRIKIIYNSENIGLAASLNKAIKEAKGFFIARMDADDISFKNRIEKEIKYLNENKLDMICSNRIDIDEDGRVICKKSSRPTTPEKIKKLLPRGNFICHPSVIVKKSVIEKLNGYRKFKTSEDYDLWLRILTYGYRIGIIDEPLIYYRIRKEGMSKSDRYGQYLISEYQKKLYNDREKYGYDNFTEENLENYLIENGYYNKFRKDKYNESQFLFESSIIEIKNKNYIRGIKLIIKSFLLDKIILKSISNLIVYNMLKKIR